MTTDEEHYRLFGNPNNLGTGHEELVVSPNSVTGKVSISLKYTNGDLTTYIVSRETFADFLVRAKEGGFDYLVAEPLDPEALLEKLVTDAEENYGSTPRDPSSYGECAWCHGKPSPHEAGCPWKLAIDHVRRMHGESS